MTSPVTATRNRLLLALAILPILGTILFVEPFPQPPAYYDFADQRSLLGVPNFWNVATNVFFLVTGIAGLMQLGRPDALHILPGLRPAYGVFFAGVLLTAFGSAYYHLAPANGPLVVYWYYSELQGYGDLRFYGLVQFLPMLLIVVILSMYPSRFDRTGFLWLVFGLYVVAKVFEHFDRGVYSLGELLSGHSIKHIVAALAPLLLLRGFAARNPRPGDETT